MSNDVCEVCKENDEEVTNDNQRFSKPWKIMIEFNEVKDDRASSTTWGSNLSNVGGLTVTDLGPML